MDSFNTALNSADFTHLQDFSAIRYRRFDVPTLIACGRKLPEQLKNAENSADKYAVLRQYDQQYRAYVQAVSQVIFLMAASAGEQSYEEELDYYTGQLTAVHDATVLAKLSILRGDLEELVKYTGKRYLIDLQMQYFLQKPETLQINAEQKTVYQKLQSLFQSLNYGQAELTLRQKLQLTESFNELLKLRLRKAKMLGYNNFGELAMSLAAGAELETTKLRTVRLAVQKYLVPLYKGLLQKFSLYEHGKVTFASQAQMFDGFIRLLNGSLPPAASDFLREMQAKGYVRIKPADVNLPKFRQLPDATLYLAKERLPLILLHKFDHITDWSDLFEELAGSAFIRQNSGTDTLVENELPDQAFRIYAGHVLESFCFENGSKIWGPTYFYRRVLQILEELLYVCLFTEFQEQIYLANIQLNGDTISLCTNLYSSLHELYFPGLKRYRRLIQRRNFSEIMKESFYQQLNVLLKLSALMMWDKSSVSPSADEKLAAFYSLLQLGANYTAVEAINLLKWPSAFDDDAIKRLAYKLAYRLEINELNQHVD